MQEPYNTKLGEFHVMGQHFGLTLSYVVDIMCDSSKSLVGEAVLSKHSVFGLSDGLGILTYPLDQWFPTSFSGDPNCEFLAITATPVALSTIYHLYIVFYLLQGIKALVTPEKCLGTSFGAVTQCWERGP